MEWLMLAGPSAVLLLLVILPGALVLGALGRSGLRSLTAAPAVSIGIMALAGLVCHFGGVRWSVLPVIAVTLLTMAVAYAFRRWGGGRAATPTRHRAPTERWGSGATLAGLGAVLGGMLLWVRHLTNILPQPHAFSQTYDNVFHLNVIRFIDEVGDPGPWLPRNLDIGAADTIFYPTAWHQLTSLALSAAGGDVTLASNAAMFAVCAVVWPLSALELTLALGVRTPGAILSTGVLAAAFSPFPFLMLDWGVLYPNLLSYACVPAALAALAALVRAGPDPGRPLLSLALVGGVSTVGVLVAHPNGLLLLLALTTPALAHGALRSARLARSGQVAWRWLILWWLGAALALAASAHLWRVARPTNRPWPPLHDLSTALTQALLANPIMGPPAPVPALLTMTGLLLLLAQRRHWWFVASSLVALLLWVVGSGAPDGRLRELLTGGWYSDSYRLAPILVLMAVPASAFAVERLLLLLGRRDDTTGDAGRPASAVTITASLLVPAAILATTQWSSSMHAAVTHARTAYDLANAVCLAGDVTCLITEDELAVLNALPEQVPPDGVVLAEPLTGASLAYAFAGRTVLRPYIGARSSPAEQVLLERLDSGPEDAGLCAALAATGVTHVLDFGPVTVHSGRVDHPGLDDLAASAAVQELVRYGDAALYEVVACR